MRFNIRKGIDLRIGDKPETSGAEYKPTSSAALLGRDFAGVKFDVLVEPGTQVRAGQPLMRDRHRQGIVFAAPRGGTVAVINRGRRRSLLSIQIIAKGEEDEGVQFPVPNALEKNAVRRLMLVSGLWTSIRTRPFGYIPHPEGEPRALLVTAIDTEPLALDPVPIISAYAEQFELGMEALGVMYDGPIFLCRAPGADIPCATSDRVRTAEFAGPHPAGLPGTHIYFLCPIGIDSGEVWHLGYQDVIALGYLLQTGKLWLKRVVMLAGPAVTEPRAIVVPLGADTDEIVQEELEPGAVRIISGSALSGHMAQGAEGFLSQRHRQITVLPEADSILKDLQHGIAVDTGLGGDPGPLIPVARLDRVSPPGILAVPLLRALLVGDIDRARDLGALELVEEDLALLTYACPSKSDYGRLLRRVLEQLHKEMG